LDGYEDGEMRSTHGQVVCPHIPAKLRYWLWIFFFFSLYRCLDQKFRNYA
jgi:hypothetical protein